jgi:predicted chitinase
MRFYEICDTYQIDEGPSWGKIKNLAAAGAIAGGLGAGAQGILNKTPVGQTAPIQQSMQNQVDGPVQKAAKIASTEPEKKVEPERAVPKVSNVSDNVEDENLLKNLAMKAGIRGVELAAFLAQCNHESQDFDYMRERANGDTKKERQRYFLKKYDSKYNPNTAEILGNIKFGDGLRYIGRGYIQITGRYNYEKAGKALGIDLIKHPELAEKQQIAAKIAVWYWLTRVHGKVSDYSNVHEVTAKINSNLSHLPERENKFSQYLNANYIQK